jgi:aconitate hydratase
LRLSGRSEGQIKTVEAYCKANMLWRDDSASIKYTAVIDLDLGSIVPSLAGPSRPQDRVPLTEMKQAWRRDLNKFAAASVPAGVTAGPKTMGAGEGFGATALSKGAEAGSAVMPGTGRVAVRDEEGNEYQLGHGAVVIAAITSCTNTSNPSVMIGAGLVAQKARARGLQRQPWVKTSLAPGSKVVTEYLNQGGFMKPLEELGFYLVGYGCTTCIGNSGPLPDHIGKAIKDGDLVVASVLSGNRNFEARIHQDIKANFLASPPLVVAYALAGTVDIDLITDPLGFDYDGKPVYLRDIWPTQDEVESAVRRNVTREQYSREYAHVFEGSAEWQAIKTVPSEMYPWDSKSTYIQNPPYFEGMSMEVGEIKPVAGARCLALLGDSVTTDHISPAGSIKTESPAGAYLVQQGVSPAMFNSYGSRRGNDRVMTRGTFANTRIKNRMTPEKTGGWTKDFTDGGRERFIFDAAMNYKAKGVPLVVIAGKDYGMGSSRDWAAKGTFLLGVRVAIAESFERIHRSNLVGMGVLPLQFLAEQNAQSLGLDGTETFSVNVPKNLEPKQKIEVTAVKPDGTKVQFETVCRVDTPVEVDYYRNGGILQTVLRRMAK